jgi:hypothetical protein
LRLKRCISLRLRKRQVNRRFINKLSNVDTAETLRATIADTRLKLALQLLKIQYRKATFTYQDMISDISLAPECVPVRSPAGNAELQSRDRKLSQRLRTVLLLIDGKRSSTEIQAMALQAGAAQDALSSLLAQGFALAPDMDVPAFASIDEDKPVALPLSEATSQTLRQTEKTTPLAAINATRADEHASISNMLTGGARLSQGRMVLLDALKKHAPVAGAMLSMRISRADYREDLVALLDEVQAKLAKSNNPGEAAASLQKARALLTE